jgi:hypothetical protein
MGEVNSPGWFIMRLLAFTAAALASIVMATSLAYAKDGVIASEPELLVVRHGSSVSVALPGSEYADFERSEDAARFRIIGESLPAGEKSLRGSLSNISWEPAGEDTLVQIEFDAAPLNSVISAVPESEYRPGVEQVIASFNFAEGRKISGPPMGGQAPARGEPTGDPYGEYELPEMGDVKYSDALVTLNVRNTDFREVLWLLSEIGGVSIILDPYWNDEPTGGRRPPGAGVDPGSGGGDGDGGGGFRPGGEFNPNVPGSGTGELSFNFENVPFDTALELVVMAAGLVMVEVR